MNNPWNAIDLQTYEAHMQLESVQQLQTLDAIMEEQFTLCKAKQVMILGIAGGNGLRHVKTHHFQDVYGIDINPAYLRECQQRYPELTQIFKPIEADLLEEQIQLPTCDLLIANLLVEYIGIARFQKLAKQSGAEVISVVIQQDTDEGFVSDSPYLHSFAMLNTIHEQLQDGEITHAMESISYCMSKRTAYPLPNGKALLRLDYMHVSPIKEAVTAYK